MSTGLITGVEQPEQIVLCCIVIGVYRPLERNVCEDKYQSQTVLKQDESITSLRVKKL